jgi:hypothetical protein
MFVCFERYLPNEVIYVTETYCKHHIAEWNVTGRISCPPQALIQETKLN